MIDFALIVAIDQKGWIWKNGTLAWNLPEDMKYFRKISIQTVDTSKMNAVIMWRKTWDSIPEKFRPLKDRVNIVVSGNRDLVLPNGVLLAWSLDKAFSLVESYSNIERWFVIGWWVIYNMALKNRKLKQLYVTEVQWDYDCDVFFPNYKDDFIEVSRTRWEYCDWVMYGRK